MKLSIATSTGVFLAMSTKDAHAFAPRNLPAPVASSTSTASGPTSLALFANNNADDVEKSNNNFDFLPKINGNAAASLLMASVLAVSTVAVVDTTAFVQPAHAEKIVVEQATQPDAKKKAPKKEAPKKQAPKKEAPKKEAPKISAEEKDLKKSNKNLDLSKQTLKAYEKLTSDAKSANSKASSALESATKNAASAKKEYGAISDKLSAAKKQKMPQTAIKELSADAGTKKKTNENENNTIKKKQTRWSNEMASFYLC